MMLSGAILNRKKIIIIPVYSDAPHISPLHLVTERLSNPWTGPALHSVSVYELGQSGFSRWLWQFLKLSSPTCTPSPPATPMRHLWPVHHTPTLGSYTQRFTPLPSSWSSTSSHSPSYPSTTASLPAAWSGALWPSPLKDTCTCRNRWGRPQFYFQLILFYP